jgi:putative inorganic carbon (HCO3(-)) transporter
MTRNGVYEGDPALVPGAAVAGHLPVGRPAVPAAVPQSNAAWALFLLLNAILFLRPGDIVPQLEGWPIYNVVILCCIAASFPAIMYQLRPDVLAQRPVTLCVFGVLAGVVASLLALRDTWSAREWAIDISKIVIYFILIVANLDSAARIRKFLVAIAVYILLLNVVALLSYHKVIDLPTVEPMEEPQADPVTGERIIVVRLVAAGIFGNPNDLSRICAVGILICIMGLLHDRRWVARLFWVGTMATFVYALMLTKSRGGLLSLGAGVIILLYARFGAGKGGLLLLMMLPAIVIFDGRQTRIDTGTGTAQERIRLWSAGLVALRERPVFGIGMDHYSGMAGNHAHNSFIESYVELGFPGGSFFNCAFLLVTYGLWRAKTKPIAVANPALLQLHPYLLSIIVATIVSQFSSSREYSTPTYMYLGMASAYLTLAGRHDPRFIVRVTPGLVARLVVASACVLVFFHVYTKLNAHF